MKLGLALLRVILGGLFVGHGMQKLTGAFGGHGPDGTGQFFESLGLRPGKPMAQAALGAGAVGSAMAIAAGSRSGAEAAEPAPAGDGLAGDPAAA